MSSWCSWATVGVLVVLVAVLLPGAGGSRAGPSQRLVASTQDGLTRTVAVRSTPSLYAKNNLWQPYLADEKTCPGGERTDLSLERQRQTLACLVNWARKKRGVRPLAIAPLLNRTSLLKARDIVRCEMFAHNPCGGDWAMHVRAAGFAGIAAENLYLGSGPWGSPRVAVDSWLNSVSHQENLFDPRWRSQGIAAAFVSTLGDGVGAILWVNEFADR